MRMAMRVAVRRCFLAKRRGDANGQATHRHCGVRVIIVIAGIKSIARAANRTWETAKAVASEQTEDTEFKQKTYFLDHFLEAQELLLRGHDGRLQLDSPREKLKYVHFVWGAVDMLSKSIKDEKRAEEWCYMTMVVRAGMVMGMDDAIQELDRYGKPIDTELMNAGKRGYFAMHKIVLKAIGKCSDEDFRHACTELLAVLRNLPDKAGANGVGESTIQISNDDTVVDAMHRYGITYSGGQYVFGPYRYEKLADAINYAQQQADRKRA